MHVPTLHPEAGEISKVNTQLTVDQGRHMLVTISGGRVRTLPAPGARWKK